MDSSKEKDNIVTTTMSKAYQITVPSMARKALGLLPGDMVDLEVEKGQVILRRAETKEEKIRRVFRELDEWRDGLSEGTKKLIEKHAGWTVNQYHEYYDSLPETRMYLEEKYGA